MKQSRGSTQPSKTLRTVMQPEGVRLNVLVVDVDEGQRRALAEGLERSGCEVTLARNGGEGLQLLFDKRFDVLVSDLVMAPMDGMTFLDEALRLWPWMGVVILSGCLRPDLCKRAVALGIRVILEKPISFYELAEQVFREATRVRKRNSAGYRINLADLQHRLAILSESARTAVSATSLDQALDMLAQQLGRILPSLATAIMSRQDDTDRTSMVASFHSPIPAELLNRVERAIRDQFEKLSGQTIPADVHMRVAKGTLSEGDSVPVPSWDTMTFPLINTGRVTGILAYVPRPDYRCSVTDISFLYIAANHLTTVLTAFHRIREVAVRDELTGLYNRHHLRDVLGSVWPMAARYGLFTGMMILDIDHFKSINDTYGHVTGDHMLKELALIVREMCRTSDLIARYGGDEFVIILPDTRPKNLAALARRILHTVRKHVFCEPRDRMQATLSIGAVCRRNEDGAIDSGLMLARADEALYAAKRGGRDRFVIWTDPVERREEDVTPSVADVEPPVRPLLNSVLVVDDNTTVLQAVGRLVEQQEYAVRLSDRGSVALNAVAAAPGAFHVALIDLNLVEMSGLDLIRKLREVDPLLVHVVITGDPTLDNAIESLRHGAFDFLQKPFSREQLQVTMRRAMDYYRLRLENREYQVQLEANVRRKHHELTHTLRRLRETFDFTLATMVSMLDAREAGTGAHSLRVRDITCFLAREVGLTEGELKHIRQGALLHDIGKIGTPDAILLKKGPLDPREQEIMREHVVVGYDLIRENTEFQEASELMLCHHEAFDGTGYPNGLKGDAIPLAARIFALVDAYDAIRSDRPYRQGIGQVGAIEEIKRCIGRKFDPDIVAVFLRQIDVIEEIGGWKNGGEAASCR